METITVSVKNAAYPVYIGRGLLARAGELFRLDRRVLIVTDDGVPAEYVKTAAAFCTAPTVVTLKAGEGSKTLASFAALQSSMLAARFDRGDAVLAIGGGMVGDLAGFAASAYMRGIDFYNIPTTLLSEVDSSVGGKTAVNLDGVKNAVGAFYQPKAVLIDPDTLRTLSPRLFAEGLAEVIKMALTFDRALFENLEAGGAENDIENVIARAVDIKRGVVEKDEREAGLRRVLNFGHTLGHGIESAAEGAFFHGECVAMGMLPMCAPAVRARLLPLLEKYGLPTRYAGDPDKVMAAVRHDKKSKGDGVTLIRVDEIGTFRECRAAFAELRNDLSVMMEEKR